MLSFSCLSAAGYDPGNATLLVLLFILFKPTLVVKVVPLSVGPFVTVSDTLVLYALISSALPICQIKCKY